MKKTWELGKTSTNEWEELEEEKDEHERFATSTRTSGWLLIMRNTQQSTLNTSWLHRSSLSLPRAQWLVWLVVSTELSDIVMGNRRRRRIATNFSCRRFSKE
jgi:hypothetical protein